MNTKEFKKAYPKYAKTKFEDTSFREVAIWEYKDLEPIKVLAEYISKTYVQPEVEETMKRYNIKDIKFTKTKIDFKY